MVSPNWNFLGILKMSEQKNRIVFIDRDGVINFDSPDYIKSEEEFRFIPGSPEAFRIFQENGFKTIIITNQSVIGRKLVTLDGLEKIFSKMRSGISSAGGDILDIFYCPHTPDDRCDCRKPEPGLFEMAEKIHAVDMSESFMIGDTSKDMIASARAGVGKRILVMTGSGQKTMDKIKSGSLDEPDYIAENLLDAAKWIVSGFKGQQ